MKIKSKANQTQYKKENKNYTKITPKSILNQNKIKSKSNQSRNNTK